MYVILLYGIFIKFDDKIALKKLIYQIYTDINDNNRNQQ